MADATSKLSGEDLNALVFLRDAHRRFGVGLGPEFVRAMDVARDQDIRAAIVRLIKHGFVIVKIQSRQRPWNSEFGSSRRSLKYKISDSGLNYLRCSEGE